MSAGIPSEIPAALLGTPSARLRAAVPRSRPGEQRRRALALELPAPIAGRALLGDPDGPIRAVPDGNRSAVLDGVRVQHAGREWLVGVKGIGAGAPLYGGTPIDDLFAHDFDASQAGVLPSRLIAGEQWMGESPYGAQGEAGASQALEITRLADAGGTIEGACICPVVEVLEIPDHAVRHDLFWYRRHRGRVLQEIRLLPSDVRLFHSSGTALGRDTDAALEGLGVGDVERLDAFVERYLATGLAALTLWARTARPCPGGLEGLDYHDAWLDKDCLVGTDGGLFVADLESVEWTPTTHRMPPAERVRHQIDRNQYELLYGLDALLDVRDRWRDRPSDAAARRTSVATRIALALAADPWVRAIEDEDGLDLEVRVAATDERIRARFLDRR